MLGELFFFFCVGWGEPYMNIYESNLRTKALRITTKEAQDFPHFHLGQAHFQWEHAGQIYDGIKMQLNC